MTTKRNARIAGRRRMGPPSYGLRFALDGCDQGTRAALTSRLNVVLDDFRAAFPGVELASAYEMCLAVNTYDLLVDLARASSNLTGEDWRVLGVAQRMMGCPLDSEDTLERAVASGVEAARIDLARTLALTERKEDAWEELRALDFDTLAGEDQAYAYRLRAELISARESYAAALPDARRAKRIAEGLPQRALVLPWCQITLAVIYEQLGEDEKALHLLGQASRLPMRGYPYVLANMARVQINLGRLDEARASLAALEPQALTGQACRSWMQLQADLLWTAGELPEALALNRELARVAEDAFDPLRAVKGYLRSAVIGVHVGGTQQALGALCRAAELACSPSMRTLTRGYTAAVRLRLGLLSAPEALAALQEARDRFTERYERPDERYMQLHACEAARHISPEVLQRELHTLRVLMQTAGHPAMLTREWRVLPELAALITPEDIALLGPPLLEPLKVWTLDRAELTLRGEVLKLGARRGVECVAYLLEHGPRCLALILRDVFPDLNASCGRNQFHQIRHRLREAIPGLEIIFEDGLYRLECDRPIWWDLAALRSGTLTLRNPEFLPSSGSDWVSEINNALTQEPSAV